MTETPRSGLRHAARLLLTSRARALSSDTARRDIAPALEQLAHDLVALARDMRAGGDAGPWLLEEYRRTIEQLPFGLDGDEHMARAEAIIGGVASLRFAVDRRDLFIIHVPEDRVALAAPLAIELIKRRLTVALVEYEVAVADELPAAVQRGLTEHRAGIILRTRDYQRRRFPAIEPHPRIRLIEAEREPPVAEDVIAWARQAGDDAR
jgi:hypothetical protein